MFRFYKKRYGRKNKKTVILMAGWKSNQLQYWLFSKLLEKNGYCCITCTYDDEILNTDPDTTVYNILQVATDLLSEISALHKQGITDICIFGTSLGTIPTILAANKSPDLKKVILNMSGANIAEIVWSWDKEMRGFKENMIKHGITRSILNERWKSINPVYNLANFKDKKVLLLTSNNDKIIPQMEAKQLYLLLQKRGVRVKTRHSNRLGHLLYGIRNLLQASNYVRELQN